MSLLILQHSDSCGGGRLSATLRDHGLAACVARPDQRGEGVVPTTLDGLSGIVILGGPQNVTDIALTLWMQREAELIKIAHAAGLPIVGICLGCQLIGHALGGTVAPRAKPAIGFHPVHATTPGQTETILAGIPWTHQAFFSCGQEVTSLPPGATLLQTAPHTKHVSFKVGLRTYAFQQHFECDVPMIEGLIARGRAEMIASGITEGELRAQADQEYARAARVADRLCLNLVSYCFPFSRRAAI